MRKWLNITVHHRDYVSLNTITLYVQTFLFYLEKRIIRTTYTNIKFQSVILLKMF
jgi:hypothetical protein